MNNGYQCRWRTYAREDGRMAIIRGEGEGDHAEVYDAFNVVRREGMQGKVVSNERVDIPGIERPGRLTPERQAEIRSGLGHMKKIADFKGQNPYEHARGCHFDGLAEMAYHEVGLHPVLLDESTALELNNDFFTVERSNDAVNFEELIIIDGAGNSNQTLNYTTKDVNPFNGVSYYRLKQTDFDGKFAYSNIVSVEFTTPKMLDLVVFPNPAKNGESIYLKFAGVEKAKEILVVVRDIMGREWYSKVYITSETDNSVFAIDPYNNIAPGVYIVTGSSDDGIYYKKIVLE